MSETILIDDEGPFPVRRPTSAAEVGESVREAAAAGQGVYPVGGRTLLDLGLPPAKPGIALDTTGLAGVVEYPARDLTITARAGMTAGALRAVLAAENQWLPIDLPDAATVGGAVATNASGPRRLGHGTLRDYVIGIGFVADDGSEAKGGGRVVKNVAGYDLMKLHTGALGTLGVITQVTLKVKPKPEDAAAVVFGCDAADVGRVLDLLHGSNSRPVVVELLNAAAWRAAGVSPLLESEWVFAVGFEEKRTTVAWQVETLLAELKATPTVHRGDDAERLWPAITALQTRPASRFIGQVAVVPSRVAAAATGVTAELVHASALSGIVWAHAAGPLPGEVWSPRRGNWPTLPRGDLALMREVKRTLDPKNVFNPGRLFTD